MFYDLKKDIEYSKAILEMNDVGISNFLGISRMSLSRWQNNIVTPSPETLDKIYDKLYDAGVNLNRLKEEMYKSSMSDGHEVLFHGAKTELIGNPSIDFSEGKKDFGRGFYLGETFNQSASFVTTYKDSSIYVFDFDKSNVNIVEFNVSRDWMILIAYFREKLEDYKDSNYLKELLEKINKVDVVIAPIADNTMYTTLDDFIQGKITDLQCLNALSANRLGKQYVFLNNEVINSNLKMLDRCYFSINEKKDYQNYRLKENKIGKNKVKLALREYAGKGKYIEELL